VSDLLPKLVFFRMLENACTEDARFDVADAEMSEAFDYLQTTLSGHQHQLRRSERGRPGERPALS
jgi:hypothetical protein